MLSLTERVRKLRKSNEYKIWHKSILERDSYQCVLCKSKERLEVDHIKSLALFPQLALNINNGRTLCHNCHKKTDTYGHLSKWKGETPIHPLLSGDLLYRIESLPQCIENNGKEIGFSLKYNPNNKIWEAGYQVKKTKLMVSGETVKIVIDEMFKILSKASTRELNEKSKLLNKDYMAQKSTKILREEMYNYISKLLNRELTNDEKQELSKIFRKGIIKYFDTVYLNEK